MSPLASDQEVYFDYLVILSDNTVNGKYGDMTFVDGVAQFSLKAGQVATAKGLPNDGTEYTVHEFENELYTATVNGEEGLDAQGVIEDGKTATVHYENSRTFGDLTVGKRLFSDRAANADQQFLFDIVLDNTTINGTYGDISFQNGVATFALKHNEKKTAEGLPADITYTVEEATEAGYTPSFTGASGTIVADETAQAAFVNQYAAAGNITFSGTKTIDGRELTDEDVFTFTVTEGDVEIASVTNNATGKINFPTINYTLDDTTNDLGVHTYRVVESVDDETRARLLEKGITVDDTEYLVTVEVVDNGDGTLGTNVTGDDHEALDFINDYEATGEITFEGKKFIDGRPLKADAPMPKPATVTVKPTSGTSVSYEFEPITYSLSDIPEGKDSVTFTYTVTESAASMANTTKDSTKHTVTVKLTVDSNGTLKATPSSNYNALNFTNKYTPPTTSNKTTSTGGTLAKTGDDLNLALLAGMATAGLVVIALGLRRRREEMNAE